MQHRGEKARPQFPRSECKPRHEVLCRHLKKVKKLKIFF
jgi:hypothetical protein